MTLLTISILYYGTSLFYLAFGALLIFQPRFVEHHVSLLFPLLAHFKLQRIANGINLLLMGFLLLIIGQLLLTADYWGFLLAFMISLWEIYLSVMFYYFERKDISSAITHLIIHLAFIVVIAGLIYYK